MIPSSLRPTLAARDRNHCPTDATTAQAGLDALAHAEVRRIPRTARPRRTPAQLTALVGGPVLPDWERLFGLALAAVSPRGGVRYVGSIIEDLILQSHPDFRRPAVFDRAMMRRWLACADAPAAVSAMRAALGSKTTPATCREAGALIDALSCTRRPGGVHMIDIAVSDGSPDGDWSIGVCRKCWTAVLMHESPFSVDGPETMWALFGGLR
jgi:hypothetical protein